MIKRHFFVLGVKRSGHHAIIHWICKQEKPSFHANNVSFGFDHLHGPITKKHPHIEHISHVLIYMADGNINFKVKYNETLKNDYDLAIYSAEDKEFSLCSKIMHEKIDCTNFTYIIVVRDPYNFVASRLRNNSKPMKYRWPAQIEVWKDHVRTCLNKDDKNFVDINFNKWFVDKDYRKYVTNILDIPFTDEGLNDIRTGKSSFDGRRFGGSAQKMEVLERWKYYKDNESYWDLIDDEMVELSKQYFGLEIERRG